jgi:hypothetical protein
MTPAPRSALSRLPGDPVSMLGHNQGPPLDAAVSWRRHAWKAARAELVPHLPIEIVRRRVARARELGLAYPAYASILMGSGRDIVAFLFTSEALGLRLRRALPLPAATTEKLRGLKGCDRLLLTAAGEPPEALAALLARAGIAVREAAEAPPETAPVRAGGAAIRGLLAPMRLPGDAVVMIGARSAERDWAEAARLARFVAADAYFAPAG